MSPETQDSGCMAVEELLLRNSVAWFHVVGWKGLCIIHTYINKELCWDCEPMGFLAYKSMSYLHYCSLSLNKTWNPKPPPTLKTHFTVTVCSTQHPVSLTSALHQQLPLVFTSQQSEMMKCSFEMTAQRVIFHTTCITTTAQYLGDWRRVYATSHVFGGIKLLRDDRCPF